jgi:hypothetical protein
MTVALAQSCDELRFASSLERVRVHCIGDADEKCSEECQEDRATLVNDESLLPCFSYYGIDREATVRELEEAQEECEPALSDFAIVLIAVAGSLVVAGSLIYTCWYCRCRSRQTSSHEPIVDVYPTYAQAHVSNVDMKPTEPVFDKVSSNAHLASCPYNPAKLVYACTVHDGLKCIICKEPLSDPMGCPQCEELFCRWCIHAVLSKAQACPQCRMQLTEDALRNPPKKITHLLSHLVVTCPADCGWTGPRSAYDEHMRECITAEHMS